MKTKSITDINPLVLSVPAGDTIGLIEEYCVHAHPISKGYNYSQTDYITFRKANGGVMSKVYTIEKTFPVEMNEWESAVEHMVIDDNDKHRLINYIVGRYRDFGFDKAPKYKLYLLTLFCDLPNEPHPRTNNAGGWLYTLKDLRGSNGTVYTVNQRRVEEG